MSKPSNLPYATFFDVVLCKGRIGDHGSLHERFALWLARKTAAALMRDPQLRKEFALSIGMELTKHRKEFRKMFKEDSDG